MAAVDIFLMLLGAGIVAMGVILWKKQKVKWVSLHSSVKKQDFAQFAKMNGVATIEIGICMASPGLFDLLQLRAIGWIMFAILLISGMALFFIAQNRYNQ
jgi:hypothetical protein